MFSRRGIRLYPSGLSRLLGFLDGFTERGTASPSTLTTDGTTAIGANVITDAVRIAALAGDGVTPPDSSVGIWEATTNYVKNGGMEINDTGWAPSGGATQSRVTTEKKFGNASIEVVVSPAGQYKGTFGPYFGFGVVAASQVWTASAWVKAPLGASLYLTLIGYDGAYAVTGSADANFTGTGDWQRVSVTFTTAANTVRLNMYPCRTLTSQEVTFYVDGVQPEFQPIPTPYVETLL